jgi:uncharacterized membrane protein YbhN (UPF0104 family)
MLATALSKVRLSFRALIADPGRFLTAGGLSALYQSGMILTNYAVARGLGIEISAAALFYIIPFAALVTMVPVTLNGIGLREGSYATAFSWIGATAEPAVALSIAVTLLTFLLSTVGGVLWLLPSEHNAVSEPEAHPPVITGTSSTG